MEGEKATDLAYALASGESVAVSHVVLDLPHNERVMEVGKALLQEKLSTGE